jgi:hypothetical protein
MKLSLTCEHVRQVFAYWERMGFVRPKVGNTETERAKNDVLAEAEWLEIFRAAAPDIFAEAAKRAAKAAKFWPKPFEVLEIIEPLEQEARPYYPQLAQPQRERKPLAELLRDCGPEAKATDFYKEIVRRYCRGEADSA